MTAAPSASPRLLIFLVAAFVRIALSALFFGSIDVVANLLDSGHTFDGYGAFLRVPYFPGIQLFLRVAGMLLLHTATPFSLAFKLFPALFDAGIAALLVDFGTTPRDGLTRGWIYAFAPLPLMLTCMHGQTDAVLLFFLLLSLWALRQETKSSAWIAGVAYTLSVIVKPVAAPLLLLILPPLRERRSRRMIAVVSSMFLTTCAYVALLAIIGWPLTLGRIRLVLFYANVGVQLIGLPAMIGLTPPRALALVVLIPLVAFYWRGKIGRERAVFLFFLFVIGTCGVSPQYLLWLVPLALAIGEIRFTALYGLVTSIGLLCYYQTPSAAAGNVENLATLAPLRRLAWLSPTAAYADQKTLCAVILLDLVMPLLCLGAFTLGMMRAVRGEAPMVTPSLSPRFVLTEAAVLIGIVILATLWTFRYPAPSGREVVAAGMARADQYAVAPYRGPGLVHPNEPAWISLGLVSRQPATNRLNVTTLGMSLAVLWGALAWFAPRRPDEVPVG